MVLGSTQGVGFVSVGKDSRKRPRTQAWEGTQDSQTRKKPGRPLDVSGLSGAAELALRVGMNHKSSPLVHLIH